MTKRQPSSNSSQTSASSISIISTNDSTQNIISYDPTENTDSSFDFVMDLRELNKDSETTFEFVSDASDILCGTIAANMMMVALTIYSLVQAGMGVQYLEDCPDEHRIPIFLFAGGTVATLKTIHVLYFNYKVAKHASDILMSRRADDMIDLVLNVFLLVWHLLGSYWTLVQWWPPENEPLYDDPNEWCDPTCYTCAVIHVVVGCSLIVCKALIHLGLAFCYNCTGVFES